MFVNNYQSLQRNIPEERRFRALSRADQQNKLEPGFVVTTASPRFLSWRMFIWWK
jgi:hypothetical protein